MASKSTTGTTITITPQTVAEIEKLKDKLGATSVAEVIQRALGLASLAVNHADGDILKLGSDQFTVNLKE